MHADEYRDLVAKQMTEATLQAQVEQIARGFGWLVYHTHDSRRSAAGFPDLCMIRPPRLVFAELKTQRGRVSPDQRLWLDSLKAVAATDESGLPPLPEVYLWRPVDVVNETITEVLR